jgi:hypothetical protein
LQIEPPLVLAAVRAGQGHRDVVVALALLHPAPTTTPTFTTTATTTPTKRPQATTAITHLKARERVSNSPTSLGATSGGCARAHPPRTRRTPSTPGSSD